MVRNGNVYTLTEDVNVKFSNQYMMELTPFLVIEKNNIVVNGAGHTVTCNGTGLGIYARGVSEVTIANFTLRNFTVGFSSYICDLTTTTQLSLISRPTRNLQIINNNIDVIKQQTLGSGTEGYGILIEFSEDVLVSGNTIKSEDSTRGLYVGSTCNRTIITDNSFIGCGLDFYTLAEKTISGNTIDNKPVIFVKNKDHQVIDGMEQVLVYNCSDLTISNVIANSNFRRTVQLEATVNSTVTACSGIIVLKDCTNNSICNNSAKTVALFSSNFNRIYSNNLAEGYVIYPRASGEEQYGRCIDLSASKYNDIYNNTLRNCTEGIHIGEVEEASQYNNIYQNTIYNASNGIFFTYGHQNYIYSNRIRNCSVGLCLQATNDIVGVQNNITECRLALYIMGSNNLFYHNNALNNTYQVIVENLMLFSSNIVYAYSINNTFDAGSSVGGNYWSNFQGVDSNSDGISETPYVINANCSDRYPFMAPVSLSDYMPPQKPEVIFESMPKSTATPTPTPTATATSSATTNSQTSSNSQNQQSTSNTKTTTPTAPELQTWIISPLFFVMSLALVAVALKKQQQGSKR
jgi:hypothetical protein